jgi:hypothetical protein
MGGSTQGITFNHVAFTIPRASLEAGGRQKILDFCANVLGLNEYTHGLEPREHVVVVASANKDQTIREPGVVYIAFIGHENPTTRTPGQDADHVGITCNSLGEFNARLDGAKKYFGKEHGETFSNYEVENMPGQDGRPGHRLHRFYVDVPGTSAAIEVQYSETALI